MLAFDKLIKTGKFRINENTTAQDVFEWWLNNGKY